MFPSSYRHAFLGPQTSYHRVVCITSDSKSTLWVELNDPDVLQHDLNVSVRLTSLATEVLDIILAIVCTNSSLQLQCIQTMLNKLD